MFSVDQLMLHLLSDYILQTDHMAQNKSKKTWVAFFHAFVYSLPFLLIWRFASGIVCYFFSHGLIDRYRLARYIAMIKNHGRRSGKLSNLPNRRRIPKGNSCLGFRLAFCDCG